MRAIFLYYKQLHGFNIPFSMIAGLLSIGSGLSFKLGFFVSILTFGLLLSLYFYEIRYSHKYYFFYNLGLSKLRLIACVSAINLMLIAIFLLLREIIL